MIYNHRSIFHVIQANGATTSASAPHFLKLFLRNPVALQT